MKPNITLEKLQLLATSLVKPEHKIQWLECRSSKPLLCESLKFPPTETSNLATQGHILSTSLCFWSLSFFPFTLSVVNRFGELNLAINHTARYFEDMWTQKSKLLLFDLYAFESFTSHLCSKNMWLCTTFYLCKSSCRKGAYQIFLDMGICVAQIIQSVHRGWKW